MTDPRIGIRDAGTGAITTVPTQYADGSAAPTDVLIYGTQVFITANDFAVLQPGVPALTSAQLAALLIAAGSSGVIGGYSTTLTAVGIDAVPNVGVFDDFLGGTLDSASWATNTGSGSSVTLPNNTGLSLATLATGGTDEQWATLTSVLSFQSNGSVLVAEAYVAITTLTETQFEFGFSDAQSEAAGLAFSRHDASVAAVADNAAVFGYGNFTGGETNAYWNADYVKATVAARVAIATDYNPVAGTYQKLTLALAKNGSTIDAAWFINDVQVAVAEDVMANSIPLYAWLTIKTKTATAKILNADYARAYIAR